MCCWDGLSSFNLIKLDDPTMSTGEAGVKARLNIPIFSSFGQFSLYILTLEKQSFCAFFHKRFRETDKLM